MKYKFFGDSYDIAKRFFVSNVSEIGYHVFVDPMFTDEWNDLENKFYKLIGALPLDSQIINNNKTALFLDPDTGVNTNSKTTKKHISIREISKHLEEHEIVFLFDQSFSRNNDFTAQMYKKLDSLKSMGAIGFYYRSHACFLFCAKSYEVLNNLKKQLIRVGLPEERLISD